MSKIKLNLRLKDADQGPKYKHIRGSAFLWNYACNSAQMAKKVQEILHKRKQPLCE
jgi:hypothetical protein